MGEVRQELEADRCRLLPCSADPTPSVSLPPATVSRLGHDLCCCGCRWPIGIDDSQSARRLANSLSLALKLLGCDEARKKHRRRSQTVTACKATENLRELKKNATRVSKQLSEMCIKRKRVKRFRQHNAGENSTKGKISTRCRFHYR